MFWKLSPLLLFAGFALVPAAAEEPKAAPFFNEKDLTGWHNSNCAADTYFVKDKELITSGKPIGILHTDKQYENFELEVEWMHVNKKEIGNSGIFIWCDSLPAIGTPFTRGIEVQVLVNYPDVGWATNHGDLFSIWGAKCKPDRPPPLARFSLGRQRSYPFGCGRSGLHFAPQMLKMSPWFVAQPTSG